MVLGLANRLILLLLFFVWAFSHDGHAQDRGLDSLTAQLQRSKPDTNRVKLLTVLAFLNRGADPSLAQKYRSQIWKLSQDLNFDKGKGWYYYLEGVDLTYKNKFSPALEAEAKAIKLGLQIKDY